MTYLQERILRLFSRHARDEDANLTDKEFFKKLVERWQKDQEAEITDVGE